MSGIGRRALLRRWVYRVRLIRTLLFEVTPTDVPTYAAVSAVLLASALIASWTPARRAARIDPQAALRCE